MPESIKKLFTGRLDEVTIGAWLTGLIGFFGGMEATFSQDEMFKYVPVHVVIWCRIIGAIGLATTLPLKGYFSTSYKGSNGGDDKLEPKPYSGNKV